MKEWFNRLYTRSIKYSNSKWSPWALFIIMIADATFLPMPTTYFFVGISLLNRRKAMKHALFATLGTFAGAMAGYFAGRFACLNANGEFTGLLKFIFDNIPGFSHEGYVNIQTLFTKYNFWIFFLVSLTSIPYGIFSVTAGAFGINILIFSFSTLVSQGIRFFFLALISGKAGKKMVDSLKIRIRLWIRPAAIITEVCIFIAVVITNAF